MDIIHLTYFLEVANHKSFTKASQALHISQPSISKGVQTLEKEWGQKLFYRHGRSIELTESGRALLPQIEAIIHQFKQLESQIYEIKGLPYGKLNIGIPPMVGSSFLSPLINKFYKQYPHIHLHLQEAGSNQVLHSLANGALQVGFIALPTVNMTPDYQTYIFNNEPLSLVLYHDHPLAKRKEVTLTEIKDESFIFFTEEFSLYQSILSYFQRMGTTPHIVCKSSNWDFIAEMVKARLGIALLPRRICQRLNPKEYQVLPLIEPYIPWTLAMIWSRTGLLSRPTQLWVEYFKNEIPEIKGELFKN